MEEMHEKTETPELKVSAPGVDCHSVVHSAENVHCQVSWEQMVGGEFVRECQRCRSTVFDLNNGTPEDVTQFQRLAEEQDSRKVLRRSDGTYVVGRCRYDGIQIFRSTMESVDRLSQPIAFQPVAQWLPAYGLGIPISVFIMCRIDIMGYLAVNPQCSVLLWLVATWVGIGFFLSVLHRRQYWSLLYLAAFCIPASLAMLWPSYEKLLWNLEHSISGSLVFTEHGVRVLHFRFSSAPNLWLEHYAGLATFGLIVLALDCCRLLWNRRLS
jgi:hypothetical protein